MHTLLTAIRRLLTWLGEFDGPAEPVLDLRDWADRPPYHPCAN